MEKTNKSADVTLMKPANQGFNLRFSLRFIYIEVLLKPIDPINLITPITGNTVVINYPGGTCFFIYPAK